MKRPNSAAIEAEIIALDECKKYAPRFTAFGDDNHEAIDAAVSALSDRLTEDMAYEISGDGEPSNEDQAKIDAAMWLAGNRAESLSSEWDSYKPSK
jgi:hypothetical protein